MIRVLLPLLLVACSGGEKAPAATQTGSAAWAASVKPWYCGSEALPVLPDGTVRTREFALKLTPGKDSFVGLYTHRAAGDRYIGSLTRFVATGDRTAKLYWSDDARKRGDATVTFSPDYSGVTITWEGVAEGQPTTATLTASDPASCPVASLIK